MGFEFREQASTWTHFVWLILTVPATIYLLRRTRGNLVKQLTLLVFGLCMALCYAGSSIYHGVFLSEELVEGLFARLDYIGIYLLIAGTVTPVAAVFLRGPWRTGTLIGAWLLAAVGVALRSIPWELPRWLSNALYLGMGWGVLLCYWELARVLSHRAMRLAVLGGVFYSVGAVLNWVGWPLLWPGVFSTHELFHLFVMAGSLCHFIFMVKVVVPFERSVEPASPETGQDAILSPDAAQPNFSLEPHPELP